MRKKLIGVMLAAAMVTGLAGCGSSSGTGTGAAAADTQATEAQKEEAKDDAKKEMKKRIQRHLTQRSQRFPHWYRNRFRYPSPRMTGVALRRSRLEWRGHGWLAIYPDNFTEG